MMRNFRLLISAIVILSAANVFSQPLTNSYPFTIDNLDTVLTTKLPTTGSTNIPIVSRLTSQNGHFYINTSGPKPERVRLFGTELQYSAQFLDANKAKAFAQHLRKLGFNAIRLSSSDYPYWPEGSFLDYADAKGSYNPNRLSFARMDTLLYELKQNGIYAFLTLHSAHYFVGADGVAQPDTVHGSSQFVHFIDQRAAQLHREWAKTLLGHVNPLTGKKYGEDPVVAMISVASEELSLYAAWRFGYLNYKDDQNVTPNGASTIGYHRSRRLDSLYTAYLLKKYGTEAGINNAWAGPAITNNTNYVDNGSFEQIGSAAWSFSIQNGATGGQLLFTPAIDSQYCLLMNISKVSPNPNPFDAYLINTSIRTGKDSLYTLSFWAKIRSVPGGVTSKSISIVINDYQYGTNSLSKTQTIDTTWKKYTFVFRSMTGGSQILYYGVGSSLGDVELDGVSIKHQQEYGLQPGEHTATATIGRAPFSYTNLLPYQRYRDMTTFYDTLQSIYFDGIQKCIRDTIKSQVLINNYAPIWWGSYLDAYANRTSDFTGGGNNIDYPRAREGKPFTDSTWIISNNSILQDAGNYALGLTAAYSIEGKPHILSNFLTPYMCQHHAELVPFLASYASLQDWDGIFLGPYADGRELLDSNIATKGNWWMMQGSGSMLASIPSASDMFKSFKIAPSEENVTITHTSDDINLSPIENHFPMPFGVEGGLDPNIGALYKVRQSFGANKHKIASEYPYLSDTVTKVSGTEQLRWSQTQLWFTANSPRYQTAVGKSTGSTISVGSLQFKRLDTRLDPIAIAIQSMDTAAIASSANLFLTIGSRSQNTGWVWTPDSLSIGGYNGTAPTLFSAPSIQYSIKSDSNRIVFHPLNTDGTPMTQSFDAIKDSANNTFTITLNQNSPWYWIEHTNAVNAVRGSASIDGMTIELFPNPATTSTTLRVGSQTAARLKVSIFDDLGRELKVIANGQLSQGMHELLLLTDDLATGHYIVRCDYGGSIITKSLQIVK